MTELLLAPGSAANSNVFKIWHQKASCTFGKYWEACWIEFCWRNQPTKNDSASLRQFIEPNLAESFCLHFVNGCLMISYFSAASSATKYTVCNTCTTFRQLLTVQDNFFNLNRHRCWFVCFAHRLLQCLIRYQLQLLPSSAYRW